MGDDLLSVTSFFIWAWDFFSSVHAVVGFVSCLLKSVFRWNTCLLNFTFFGKNINVFAAIVSKSQRLLYDFLYLKLVCSGTIMQVKIRLLTGYIIVYNLDFEAANRSLRCNMFWKNFGNQCKVYNGNLQAQLFLAFLISPSSVKISKVPILFL